MKKYEITYYWMGIDRTIVCYNLDQLIEELETIKDNNRCGNWQQINYENAI